MLLSVFNNKHITVDNLCKKYNSKFISLGDKLESNIKTGSKNKIDSVTFIKLKRLKPLIDSFSENDNKCFLLIKNKQQLINTLNKVIN